jgi:multicomponent Na+:H+ antiporter subunit D
MASTLIAVTLAVPVVGAVFIAALHRHPNLREAATLLTAALLFLCVTMLLPQVLGGQLLCSCWTPARIGLAFRSSRMLFALVASGLWILNSVYSFGYMRSNGESHQTRFYVCFALALAASIGIAYAGNVFTLFVFYELLTLITYPLVTHHGTAEARRGGRIYLGLLIGTSMVLLLPAVIFTWQAAGTTDFQPGGILDGKLSAAALAGLLALYMFGIGKAALMPFHRWLPAAMVAPTPVSALLHAVAVVKAGVFSVVKVLVYVFGVDVLAAASATDWLVVVAGFTILAASVVALRSDNLKRRLAYSTVSQLSYVVLAAALLAPLSIVGAVMHIAAHALGKITLFFAADDLHRGSQDRVGHRGIMAMPWTMGAGSARCR